MKKSIFWMGIGAGLMYFFDPELGWVRRGLLMDRLRGRLPRTNEAISSKATELTETVDSVAAETIDSLGGDVIGSPEGSDSETGSEAETTSQG